MAFFYSDKQVIRILKERSRKKDKIILQQKEELQKLNKKLELESEEIKIKEKIEENVKNAKNVKDQFDGINEESESDHSRSFECDQKLTEQKYSYKDDLKTDKLTKYQKIETTKENIFYSVKTLENEKCDETEMPRKIFLRKDTERAEKLETKRKDLSRQLKKKEKTLEEGNRLNKENHLLVKDISVLCELLLEKRQENVQLSESIKELNKKLKIKEESLNDFILMEEPVDFKEEPEKSESNERLQKFSIKEENENVCMEGLIIGDEVRKNETRSCDIEIGKNKITEIEIECNETEIKTEIKIENNETETETESIEILKTKITNLEIQLSKEKLKNEILEDEVINLKSESQAFEPRISELIFSFSKKEEELKKGLERKTKIITLIEEVLIEWQKPTEE